MKKQIFSLVVIMFLLCLFFPNISVNAFDSGDIFYEYGAEAGPLESYWDSVFGDGITQGLAQINDTYSRSGDYSIYMYQKEPVKTDAERRVHLRIQNISKTEGYLSWWIYFDEQMLEQQLDWGTTLGGWQLWWGPEDEKLYRWWTGGRFGVLDTSRRLTFNYRWGNLEDAIIFSSEAKATEQSFTSSYYLSDYTDEWVHLQLYWKIGDGNGVVRAWFNNNLIAELTGLINDPRGYDEWYDDPINGGECAFHPSWCGGLSPEIGLDLYQDTISNDNWLWADDIVAADVKVPEDYYLGGEYEDTNAPTYSAVSHSTTNASTNCLFSSTWTDNIALSGFIFGTNNTGSWQNETLTSLYTNPDTAEKIKTLTPNVGYRVEYQFWVKDTSDNWNTTGLQGFTVTAAYVPPTPPPEEEEEPTPPAEDEITESFLSVPSALAVALTISSLAARTLLSLTIVAILVVLAAIFTRDRLTLTITMLAGMAISVAFGFLDIFFLILSALIVALLYSGLINKVIGDD